MEYRMQSAHTFLWMGFVYTVDWKYTYELELMNIYVSLY